VPLYVSCLADVVGKGITPIWPLGDNGAGQWGAVRSWGLCVLVRERSRYVCLHMNALAMCAFT
jgi:hypothetical protein